MKRVELSIIKVIYLKRSSDPADPVSVREARFLEMGQIQKWIDSARSKN